MTSVIFKIHFKNSLGISKIVQQVKALAVKPDKLTGLDAWDSEWKQTVAVRVPYRHLPHKYILFTVNYLIMLVIHQIVNTWIK